MTYFRDLTDYEYHATFYRPGTKNVGWLGSGFGFDTTQPTEELLSRLWDYCKISIAQTRGIHDCEFCPGQNSYFAERNGEHLLLGTAEIRVFRDRGTLYAAPTLIYHYIAAHNYRPPNEFVEAIINAPSPFTGEYLERLATLNLDWHSTPAPSSKPLRLKLGLSDR